MRIYFEVETKEDYTETEVAKMAEIFSALVEKGSLSGMKNGSANIHFDANGDFVGLRHDYWPWKARR
jgi:hypothetical protein